MKIYNMGTIIFTLSIILAACWIITLLFFQWLKWREKKHKKNHNTDMFLDDKLFDLCKNSTFNGLEWTGQLYDDVIYACTSYITSKIHPDMEPKELKTVIKRTFNYYDAFVKKAKASEDPQMKYIGQLFGRFHFKKLFLFDEKLREIYEKHLG